MLRRFSAALPSWFFCGPTLMRLLCVLSALLVVGSSQVLRADDAVRAAIPGETTTNQGSGRPRMIVPPGGGGGGGEKKEENEEPAPQQQQQSPRLAPLEIFNKMLPSTVWLRVEWTESDGTLWNSVGTGWVYDVERRLVVTNEHVVHNFDAIDGYMPQTVDGELVHEPNWYLQNGQRYTGTVIDRDTERDLALIQFDQLPPEAAALKLAQKSPDPGDRIFAVAGLPEGSEGLWIMTSGEVRQVYRRSHANGHFARVVETQLPTNRGNSGGAVVNDRLEVVAVVEGHMIEARLVSMFIDVNEIRDYLAEAVPLAEPQTAADFNTRASRRYDEGRYDQAIADYTEAIRLDPQQADALLNRGWTFFVKEDYDTAIADFEGALKVDPELAGAYEGRGVCHREMERYDEAIRDFTEAIRRVQSDPGVYQRRATTYQLAGRLEEALKDRNRAIELDGSVVDYWIQRGQTLRELRRFDDSRRDFEQAISLDPSNSHPYYEAGYTYYDEEKYQQAILFFTMAIERDNAEPIYRNMRGLCYRELELYAEAEQDFLRAIELNPRRALYHWHMGLNLYDQGQLELSIQAMTNYIQLEPDDPDGYEFRGDVYEELGNEAAAAADRAKMKKLQQAKKS